MQTCRFWLSPIGSGITHNHEPKFYNFFSTRFGYFRFKKKSESLFENNRIQQRSYGDSNVIKKAIKIEPNLFVQSLNKVEKGCFWLKHMRGYATLSKTVEKDEENSNDSRGTVVKKPFKTWRFEEVCEKILKRNYPTVASLPRLEIDELGKERIELTDKENERYKDLIESYKNSPASNFSQKRLLLQQYFLAAIMQMHEKNIPVMFLMEMELEGSCASGILDYGFYNGHKIIAVAIEARKENYKKGVARAIVEMHVAIEEYRNSDGPEKNLQDIYGIVTDGNVWIFLKYTWKATKGPKVKISEPIIMPNDVIEETTRRFHDVFDWIFRIFEIQIKNLSELGVLSRKGLRQIPVFD